MTINFNPRNAYWEEAIQQQLDARAEENGTANETLETEEATFKFNELYAVAFADLEEEVEE